MTGENDALADEPDLPDDDWPEDESLVLFNAVGLRLDGPRVLDYDAGDAVYRRGERLVCERGTGLAYATVVVRSRRILARGRLPRVLRRATDGDLDVEAQLRAREHTLFAQAQRAVQRLQLPVKVVRAEALYGGQKFAVYFASEERIEYKELLRAIAQQSRERIELRQLGARDTAKLVGGVGPCGLELCCCTFMTAFSPVSIRMAKDQGLALNPQKVSGVCGRLLCCLVFEEALYRAQRKLVPKVGERVVTREGPGRVREVDVLGMVVHVLLDTGVALASPVSDLQRKKARALSHDGQP